MLGHGPTVEVVNSLCRESIQVTPPDPRSMDVEERKVKQVSLFNVITSQKGELCTYGDRQTPCAALT